MRRCLALALAAASLGWMTPARAASPSKQECVSANESAQDLRRAGRLHEARVNLATCLATSCPRPVREDCAQRLADIEAAMPTVVFVVKDASSNDLSDVRVTMDGKPLLAKLEGAAVAIDPGEHHFTFEAEGFRRIETSVVLREGDKKRRVMVFLDAAPGETLIPAPAPTGTPAPETVAPPPPPEEATVIPATAPAPAGSDGRGQRVAAFVVGSAGLVGVAVGSAFGILSKSTYDHSVSENQTGATVQANADHQTAVNQAAVATGAFVASGVLVGLGALLYFTAPTRPSSTTLGAAPHTLQVGIGPEPVDHGGGLALRGSW